MAATITEQTVHALEIVKVEEIAAPIGVVFETILEQMGPENEAPGTGRMPMELEAWPGGRWYRDLGNDTVVSRLGCSDALGCKWLMGGGLSA
jgi:hypothetical protein